MFIADIQNKTVQENKNKQNVEIVLIQEILLFKKSGGFRSNNAMNSLTNNIIANGIQNPIELIKNKNGQIEIYNGNHRLEIANQLGLTNIPVKFINDVETNRNIDYNEVENFNFIKGEENGNNKGIDKLKTGDGQSRVFDEHTIDNRNELENRQTISRNGRISKTMGRHNDGTPSSTTYGQNIEQSQTEQGLDSGSFFDIDTIMNNQSYKQDLKNIESKIVKLQNEITRNPNIDEAKVSELSELIKNRKSIYEKLHSQSEKEVNSMEPYLEMHNKLAEEGYGEKVDLEQFKDTNVKNNTLESENQVSIDKIRNSYSTL